MTHIQFSLRVLAGASRSASSFIRPRVKLGYRLSSLSNITALMVKSRAPSLPARPRILWGVPTITSSSPIVSPQLRSCFSPQIVNDFNRSHYDD